MRRAWKWSTTDCTSGGSGKAQGILNVVDKMLGHVYLMRSRLKSSSSMSLTPITCTVRSEKARALLILTAASGSTRMKDANVYLTTTIDPRKGNKSSHIPLVSCMFPCKLLTCCSECMCFLSRPELISRISLLDAPEPHREKFSTKLLRMGPKSIFALRIILLQKKIRNKFITSKGHRY